MTVKKGALAKIPLLKRFAATEEVPIPDEEADEVANAKGQVAELPDPTPEQMGAFKGYEPKALGDMVHNKFLNELRERGGAEAVIAGLHTDASNGLSESGAPSGTSIDDRRRIYGENRIPQRKAKTLLQLMWIAFQDKILVSRACSNFICTAFH
jgi:Ca2+-transporting ATPase